MIEDDQYSVAQLLQLAGELALEVKILYTSLQQVKDRCKAVPEPEWVNSATLARKLGICPRTLANLRSRGKVKGHLLHGKLFYRSSEVKSLPGYEAR